MLKLKVMMGLTGQKDPMYLNLEEVEVLLELKQRHSFFLETLVHLLILVLKQNLMMEQRGQQDLIWQLQEDY